MHRLQGCRLHRCRLQGCKLLAAGRLQARLQGRAPQAAGRRGAGCDMGPRVSVSGAPFENAALLHSEVSRSARIWRLGSAGFQNSVTTATSPEFRFILC